MWSRFDADKPRILGGIFAALSGAMRRYPDVELPELHRMADFTRWGYAIAESLGYTGQSFLDAYRRNIERSNSEAIASHPVAAALMALMRDRQHWQGSVAALLNALEAVALTERINTRVGSWPKAAHIADQGRPFRVDPCSPK
ncbi:MAG: hypothetical protein OWU32_13905 [Firmicutes bacterium]|nr:hypothetical protein [Bacillota bacterium]